MWPNTFRVARSGQDENCVLELRLVERRRVDADAKEKLAAYEIEPLQDGRSAATAVTKVADAEAKVEDSRAK